MANEFTLADYQATAADPLSAAVVQTWREASPLLDMLTFKTNDLLSQKFIRFNTLPTATWRKIGESFVQMKVNPDTVEERLYFMGGKIDIPREYVKAGSMVNQRVQQEQAALKAMAFGFNEAFFINTPLVDEDAPIGLWYRLVNDFASAQSIDSAALDISPDTSATNVAHKLFDFVDAALDQVDGNPGDKVLWMNTTVYRRFQSLCRQSSLLATTKDNLGRQFTTYGEGGPKIMDVGYKRDLSTHILPDTELDDGTALTGGAASSIIVTRFGEPYVAGWCQEMPFAEDKGELEDGVSVRTIVRFSPGLYMLNPRSISRVYALVAA